MAERLRPDGGPVRVGQVTVRSPGLAGRVEVRTTSTGGTRGVVATDPRLREAMAAQDLTEQLTVEFSETRELPGQGGTGQTRSVRGEPGVSITVPAPGDAHGQFALAEDEQGLLRFVFPDPDPPAGTGTRAGGTVTYTVPRRVGPAPEGDGTRGFLGWVGAKLIKVVLYPLKPLLGRIGETAMRAVERRYRPERLVWFPEMRPVDGDADWARLRSGPVLLLVHGTNSSSTGGFGHLGPLLPTLAESYGGRVIAYDHPTLSVTPVDNARDLVSRVPAGAGLEVDVLAHSRGGIVSRVLCEMPEEAGLTPDRLLVRKLVMVATPNAGTALAHPDHLGDWLDRAVNLFALFPDNPVTDSLEIVLAVAKQVAVGLAEGLDGYMSMTPTPEGYLATTLNVARPHGVTYHAIAADFEPARGSRLWSLVTDQGADLVFRRDGKAVENDLVVPTRGVYAHNGASAFPIAEPELFTATDAVSHSTYWAKTRALSGWLTG